MYTLILLSGGRGTRMQNSIPKQYLLLAGKPIIMHTLEKVDKIDEIDEIIIVCEKEYISKIDEYIKSYRLNKKISYTDAGKTRQESVYNGLKLVTTDYVIIHEAARPFVNKNEFKKIINSNAKNVTYVQSVNFTVLKEKDKKISGLLNRNELVNIQLPQKFETEPLLKAHEKAIEDNKIFTEDASILYYYENKEISTLQGTPFNIKITEPPDLILAEILYKENLIRED